MGKRQKNANQYNNLSLVAIWERKYGKSAQEVFQEFVTEGHTIETLSEATGFAIGTIKKYSHRFNIYIPTNRAKAQSTQIEKPIHEWYKRLSGDVINPANILSKRW